LILEGGQQSIKQVLPETAKNKGAHTHKNSEPEKLVDQVATGAKSV